jgi:cytochrome-b5 reductase
VRSYTPISGDDQPGYFDLLIKSYPQGNISRHMASLAVGQTIRVKGPKGAFVYTPNMVRHFGMIAGGTGITPMLQIIKAIARGRKAGDTTQVDLIFANVTEQDILLREDLDQLAREDKGFRVHYVLDKPPAGWQGGVGYVTAEMIQVSFEPLRVDRRPQSNERRLRGSGLFGSYEIGLANMGNSLSRNGCPSLPTTSRSCCAARRP